MTKDNGGPAFPQKRIHRDSQGIDHEVHDTGMSLHDWYAGQAIQGILSQQGLYEAAANRGVSVAEFVALCAADIANAMIAARNE